VPDAQSPSVPEHEISGRIVLIVTTFSAFLAPFMASAVNLALPSIASDFSLNAIALSWVASSYLLTSAISLVPLGQIADRRGRKVVFKAGVVGYAIASTLCGISSWGWFLICARILQGAAAAMMFGTSTAILVSAFPANERGRVIGINVAAVYAGLSLGPVIGGFMVQSLGWRSIFLANAVFCIPLFLMLRRLGSDAVVPSDKPFDRTGSVMYAVALFLFMYGLSTVPSATGVVCLGAGIVSMVGFFTWEHREAFPVFPIDLFVKVRVFRYSAIAALINYGATAATGFLLSLYLQHIKGLGPRQAGLVLLTQPLIQTIVSPVSGKLSDKIEPQLVASVGMGCTAVGLALLSTIGMETGYFFLVGTLVLLGFGFALFSSPNTNALMSSVDRPRYGIASSTVATMRLTGQLFSIGAASLMFALILGPVRISPDVYPQLLRSIDLAFLLFALLCAVGILPSLSRGKLRESP
jgi:MFS family permease